MRHLLALTLCVAPTLAQPDYNADVLPILSRRCFACHGPDGDARQAEMRLDTFEGATAARGRHGAAIVPGDAERSLVLHRVTDADDPMPPEGERLTAAEIATLRAWIEDGAPYDEPWAWKPVRDPEPPSIDDPWIRDDIDRFVLDRLRQADVEPAPEAPALTLIRRVTTDLTGLPPTPEEIDAFLADDAPGAYDRVVDRLLASPRFGEHWGRHWLDLMRYAESHGHEFDYPIHYAWKYRDYVIRAFNDDVPYDRFVREHIAGDMLEPRLHPTEGYNESVLATGWWWLSQGTHAPVDVRLDEAERADNQIDVLSKTFLSVTVSCARCNDHKFDRISTKDYYGLFGFVQSSRRDVAYLDPGSEIERAIEALRPVNDRLRDRVDRALSSSAEREFLAACEVLHGEPRPDDTFPSTSHVLFDFESGTWDGWTVEGTAFGDMPRTQETVGPYQGDIGAPSKFFANSHLASATTSVGGADDHLGSLTSVPFTIDQPWLRFHVGGGRHPGRTGMRLVIDGEVVRTVTGHDSNFMRQDSWNVREFMGREAHLVIFDDQKGHWGHINIDAIVLDARPHDGEARRPIDVVAREHEVDSDVLARWVDALGSSSTDVSHPMHAFAHGPVPESGVGRADLLERLPLADWIPSGFAFETTPPRVAMERGRVRLPEPHQIHSGVIDERLQGTLRSPDFELSTNRLHYRVRGRGVIRLIIDGYWLDEFNALLFGGIRFDVDTENWETRTQHLDLFLGETAHIEIIDDGDGSLVVDAIWFGEDASPPVHPLNVSAPASQEDRDRWYASLFADPDEHRGLADWMVSSGLAGSFDDESRGAIAVPGPMRALAICEGDPQDERVFIRGGHRNLGEVAPRSFIDSIAGEDQPALRSRSGRPELAERMLDERNPLLTRSIVNRTWHHLFGRGLCPTVDDFGALGSMPTHP
ncbi:MAG: DUF1549 domain-containing protein, partial [Phycisphaerales bacterium]|nr:DUF1549 domain-containing protein [Phycisphaerales bacterium]